MFKDRYRADNDKIEPDKALLNRLSVKMKEATEKVPAPQKSRSHIRMQSAAALAACLVFAVTGVSVYNNQKQNSYPANGDYAADSTQINSETETPDSSYANLYSLINSINTAYDTEDYKLNAVDTTENLSNSGSYSKTNIQVDGVDEADIVKTDGRYIYTHSDHGIFIVDTDGGNSKVVSRISCDSNAYRYGTSDIFVSDNRLVILQEQRPTGNDCIDENESCNNHLALTDKTQAVIYDITNKSNPVLIGTPGQSGEYLTSRMVGNMLYLVSNYYIVSPIEEDKPETFVPEIYNGDTDSLITSDNICISTVPKERQYVVVSAINVQNSKIQSTKSVLGCGKQLYANANNLYIASVNSIAATENTNSSNSASSSTVTTYSNKTDLIRLSLNNGQLAIEAKGSVPGTLLNQYSMDEYNGIFRLVTDVSGYETSKSNNGAMKHSQSESSSALYTLDQNLNIIGSITGIAKGELVYSVRFNGTVGYFVTFRRVDPLFAVDLSDPVKPKILSALKIPGLSDYLHLYADGLLFGLGRNADENTGHVSGLKLSMFDVSNPSNITEKNKLLLNNEYSKAIYNYKAILVSADRNLIALPAGNKYLVFSYSAETGFTQKAEILSDQNPRGLFIDDTFYTICNSAIRSYSMDNYNNLSTIYF